jgi:hypothetical protein
LFGDGPYLSILNLNGTINRLLFYSQL